MTSGGSTGKLSILVLGGGRFVGRHLVDAACQRGHQVTLFNRGRSALHRDDLQRICGDRSRSLEPLGDRCWDAVIDCCGCSPSDVSLSADSLASRCGTYLFISTVSVYDDADPAGIAETGRLYTAQPDGHYGCQKVACEGAVARHLPRSHLILRPGLIVGPWDYTGRFTYWVTRLARGGTVLAPDDGSQHAQFIDARDLAHFAIDALERELRGVFNVIGPPTPLRFDQLLRRVAAAIGAKAVLRWVPESLLLDGAVRPWTELPMWLPKSAQAGFFFDAGKARQQGLQTRPVEETATDLLAWAEAEPQLASGEGQALSTARERELLERFAASAARPSSGRSEPPA